MRDILDIPDQPRPLTHVVREMMDQLDKHRELIEDTLAHAGGTHTFDDVVYQTLTGKLRLWNLPNSFMLTEVIIYPQKKVYNVFLAGGRLDEILPMQEPLVEAAREMGCTTLALSGRKGWVKALKPLGWTEDFTVCTYRVT